MRALKILLLALAAALLGGFFGSATVHAGEGPRLASTEAPALKQPLPFDHAAHAKAFDKARLSCVDCHPIGAFVQNEGSRVVPSGPIDGPRSSCHACHLGEVEGAPRRAPGACLTCHAERRQLLPADHGPEWIEEHGDRARDRASSCTDCHDTNTCVACHEARGALTDKPHGPGWGALHGVEARLDPRSCSSCHTGDTCVSCHVEGVLPW